MNEGPLNRGQIIIRTFKSLESANPNKHFPDYFLDAVKSKSVYQNNIDNRLKALVKNELLNYEYEHIVQPLRKSIEQTWNTRVYSFAKDGNDQLIDAINKISEYDIQEDFKFGDNDIDSHVMWDILDGNKLIKFRPIS